MELSGLDIRVIISQLASSLKGYYVNNIYSVGGDRVLVKFHHPEKTERRFILSTEGVWPTKYDLRLQEPTRLVKALRGYLLRTKLTEIAQPATERIVIFSLEGRDGRWKIIGEFFGRGNIILLDSKENDKILVILNPLKTRQRELFLGGRYSLPQERGKDPFAISVEDIRKIMSSELNVSKWLVSNISLPRKYAEEILRRANIDGERAGKEVTQKEAEAVFHALRRILELTTHGESTVIVYDDGNIVDVTPFPLLYYEDFRGESAPTFMDAIDTVKTKEILRESTEEDLRPLRSKIEDLEKGLEAQRKKISEFREKESKLKSLAGGLRSSPEVELRSALQILEEKVEAEVQEERGIMRLEVFESDISIPAHSSSMKLASELYTLAKRFQAKLIPAEEALNTMEDELSSLKARLERKETVVTKGAEKITIREKMWFERYRWFTTSEGLLALGGRDASSNSSLIRKHMKGTDLVFHGDLHGSPFFLLKGLSKEEYPASVVEVAQAVVSFSRAWKDQFSYADSFWVFPEQVKSQAPSGMYLPKGSFLITGKKNYIKGLKLDMAVGVCPRDGSVAISCGPFSAIKKNSLAYVEISPWREGVTETAKKIMHELSSLGFSEVIKAIGLDEIVRVLPGGGKVIAKGRGDID